VTYALGVLAAIVLGTSFVLQQGAAQQAPDADFLRFQLLVDLLHKPRWLAGIGTMILGQLLSAWVEGHIILALSAPLLATNLLVALSLAWPLSGQPIAVSEIIGALVLLTGAIALSVAQSVSSAHLVVGSPRYWPYCGAAVAIAVAALAAAGRGRSGNTRATLAGAGAGLVFGTQDALTRLVVDAAGGLHQLAALLTNWPVYALVMVGGTGLWLMQNAFSAAPLHVSRPPITAVEPVCAMVLGIVVFREKVPVSPAMIALQVAGLVALVTGVVLVARAPALASLHHAPPTSGRRDDPRAPARVSRQRSREDGPGSNRQGYRSSGREGKS
jgi:drug/metabolite transporter (DMT)-like permease